jgi:hypothetical protein
MFDLILNFDFDTYSHTYMHNHVLQLNSSSHTEDELVSAASCLICEWAQKLLGVTFKSLRDLACHLVENLCVDSRSVAAFTILSASSGSKAVPSCTPSRLCGGKGSHSS